MARIPSTNILAKDVIGWAEEIASVEDARKLIQRLGIIYYNNALAELYNIMLMAGMDEYESSADASVALGNATETSANVYNIDMSGTSFDSLNSIKRITVTIGDDVYECIPINAKDYDTYRGEGCADFPYNESVIYRRKGLNIGIIIGKDIYVDTPVFEITFRRNLTLLTTDNYDSTYIDIPENYINLLTNRIASYAELRNGISDKSLQIVKFIYEQLLSNIEPAIKSKIFNVIDRGTK